MGKTYIDTVKYVVYANVEIGGMVEKPDVVGAIFGQTEGLLGDELDLRELQKNGRIGRIEVDLTPRGGRSVGKIKLPSSLDMVETCILAAALETVDRVGPCEARIGIEKVEDTRTVKRKGLVDRAKNLLKNLLVNEIPESKEISEQVRSEVKSAEVTEYGPDKLPAGPGIERVDSIILTEGRADVINLLKNDIANVVGVGGANVSPTVARLCQEKEVTVFLDGDRGGDIILAELARISDIDFVARAPAGKEVEELTRKEIIKCLRAKVPFEQGSTGPGAEDRRAERYKPQRSYERKETYQQQSGAGSPPMPQASAAPIPPSAAAPTVIVSEPAAPAAPAFGYPGAAASHTPAASAESGYTGRPPRGDRYGRREERPSPPQWASGIGGSGGAGMNTFGSAQTGLGAYGSSAPAPSAGAMAAPASSPAQSPPGPIGRPAAPVESAPAAGAAPAGGAADAGIPGPSLSEVPRPLLNALDELENTLRARFYNAELGVVREVPVRDMIKSLDEEPAVHAVVFDGIITQRLADLAESKKAVALVGVKLGNVFRKPAHVLLHTKN